MEHTTHRIARDGRVFVGKVNVGRLIDAKPHNIRWIAKDRAGRQTHHFTKNEAAAHLAKKWSGR